MTSQDLADLLAAGPASPRVSVYQPTHRHHPDNTQDPIRFRNLLRQAQASLRRAHDEASIDAVLAPLASLADDADFWNHATDGLAAFSSPGVFRVFRLQRSMPELAIVADSFHLKPLLRVVQSADRFQVLALQADTIRLYEGNRDALDEVPLAPEVLAASQRALADHEGATRGGGLRHGSRKDEADKDVAKFFRAVDRAVDEHHSRRGGLPLLLAALPEHQGAFRRLSGNPLLMEDGVAIGPSALSVAQLRESAWRAFEPRYLERLGALVERFGAARGRGLGTEDPNELAPAADAGRVGTLLVEARRVLPGRLVPTGTVPPLAAEPADLAEPGVDDLLDDLAERVLRTGGEVVVVPRERMPTATGLAATFRF
jgi:hypothetical protein